MLFDPRTRNVNVTLEQLANEGFTIIKNISTDFTAGLNVQDLYYDYLFDMIQNEFESLESVSLLVKSNKFKDCFSILRSVFEMMLYFWLTVHGKKYRFYKTYTITPTKSITPEQGRNQTYDLWMKKWKEGDEKYTDIIQIQKIEDNRILLVTEHEGLYESGDTKKENYFIPNYFFILTDHYDHYVRFNSELPSIKTGDFRNEEKHDEFLDRQKILYNKYIRIEAIIKNLLLNNLITKIQRDYVRVHYNYLSSYIHPSKTYFQFSGHRNGFTKSDVPDDIVAEQIWLYICRLQYLLLKILIERIEKYNPNARLNNYKLFMNKINLNTAYFWFIDNDPTPYDRMNSDQRKNLAERFGQREQDDVILYYEDPVQRLHNFKNWF